MDFAVVVLCPCAGRYGILITFAGPSGQPFDLILKITDALVALGNLLALVGSPGFKFFNALLCSAEEFPQLLGFSVVVLRPGNCFFGILVAFFCPFCQSFDFILEIEDALIAQVKGFILRLAPGT